MFRLLQPGLTAPRSVGARWLALLAILLIAVMSTAQACHTHDLLPPRAGTQQDGGTPHPDTTPDHCPLCVAMHSALPAELQTAPEPVLLLHAMDSAAADAERLFRWRFQLASRPPPASNARA